MVLYTGFSSDLKRRVHEHRSKKGSFSRRYNVNKLVYYELCEDVNTARVREVQLKAGSRKKKLDLINSINPNWEDLYDKL
jgi:putative endonuclease